MKTKRTFSYCFFAVAALAGSFGLRAAQTTIPNGTFDTEAAVTGWAAETWDGATPGTAVFDGTLNSPLGQAGSGSMKLTANFAADGAWQQAIFTKSYAAGDASGYKQLWMDVKVDPSSTPRAGGDYGYLQAIIRDGGNWDWRQAGFFRLTGTDWQRVRFTVPAQVTAVQALSLQLAESGHLGPVTVNVDNIQWSDSFVAGAFDMGSVEGWRADWGTTPVLSHSADDAGGLAGSGSLKVDANYFVAANNWQQAIVSKAFAGPVDMSGYTKIELDVKVDAGSTIGGNGNYGFFEVKNPNGGAAIGAGVNLTSTEWTHLTYNIPPTLTTLSGLILQLGSGAYLGPVAYYVDNVTLIPRVGETPPPTLSIERARTGGLTLLTTGSGAFDRHNVRTLSSMADDLSFVDKTAPMTYSLELLSYPSNPPYAGFQMHVFLVPGAAAFQNDSTPDWNAPTLIFLDFRAAANGAGGTMTFRSKLNAPGGNTGIYAAGLPSLTTTKLLGTWTIAVADRKNFTITAPGGEILNTTISDELAAAFFTDEPSQDASLAYYVGVQPNNDANKGQGIVLGSLSVKEGETPIVSDVFTTGPLDPANWTIAGPADAVQFYNNPGFLVSWTLPDTGFTGWQYATQLTTPDWTDTTFTGTAVTLGGNKKQLLIPTSELPNPATGQLYLRMVKPPAP